MKSSKNFLVAIVFVLGLFLGGVQNALAASLSVFSNTDVLNIGDTLEVAVKVDSEGSGINAVQGTLQYPKDILEATKVDRSDSILNFWLQEPAFSNANGQVTFVGGSTVGSVGKSLQILRVSFKVKGSGRAELTFTDAAITASDGSGTNVLSTVRSLVVNSVPKTGVAQTTVVPTQIPAPVQITRAPVAASGLPAKPELTIPLYSSPSAWFNRTDTFIAQWKLPPDVSAVATSIDQNISFAGTVSEGLFDNKVFPAISRDGIWYLHVRFKNNIGWGPANNYRVAVDTRPPLSFDVSVNEGVKTDTPMPTLKFVAKDSLSGIREYRVVIDGGEALHIPSDGYTGTYKLPLLFPGKHRIAVIAADNADNSTENDVAMETVPIASPVISFVTKEIIPDKQTGVAIKGSAASKNNILLSLRQDRAIIAEGLAAADDSGNWTYTFGDQLKNGNYIVDVRAQDARGALSLIVSSDTIVVQAPPIIQIGFFQLGAGGTVILLIILLVGGFATGIWFWRKKNEKLAFRVGFAQAEISKMFNIINTSIKGMSDALKTPPTSDDEYAIKKLENDAEKMESYLKKGIEKIKK